MALSIEDQVKGFLPANIYYAHKIAREVRKGEPELAILHDIVPVGCTAVDVGCNRGYYSWALSKIASRVVAFEPNADLVSFARRKLGSKVTVHEVALTNREGRETFFIPQSKRGIDSHLVGNLGNLYPDQANTEHQVTVATLNSFGLDGVGFIKIDVEGAEIEVIEGALETIKRCRPNILAELMLNWHDSRAEIMKIVQLLDYEASILVDRRWMPALDALEDPDVTVLSNNVVFKPRQAAQARRNERI